MLFFIMPCYAKPSSVPGKIDSSAGTLSQSQRDVGATVSLFFATFPAALFTVFLTFSFSASPFFSQLRPHTRARWNFILSRTFHVVFFRRIIRNYSQKCSHLQLYRRISPLLASKIIENESCQLLFFHPFIEEERLLAILSCTAGSGRTLPNFR